MERYTYFDGGKWRLKIGDIEYSGDWVERLAAYEDTGLEPEAVEHLKLASMGKAIAEIKEFEGIPVARLRELAQAEKEGRLRIVGVPKGACCGTCEHFEREAGTSHGACKPENHNWAAQPRTACKGHYTPISEAAPTVHGRWVMNSDRPDIIICTVCNAGFDVWKHESKNFKFCPNCGAKMDGGKDNG